MMPYLIDAHKNNTKKHSAVTADVNLPLGEGELATQTALHAVLNQSRNIEVLDFLLENGADPHEKELLLTCVGDSSLEAPSSPKKKGKKSRPQNAPQHTVFFAKAYKKLVPLLSTVEHEAALEHLLNLPCRDGALTKKSCIFFTH